MSIYFTYKFSMILTFWIIDIPSDHIIKNIIATILNQITDNFSGKNTIYRSAIIRHC